MPVPVTPGLLRCEELSVQQFSFLEILAHSWHRNSQTRSIYHGKKYKRIRLPNMMTSCTCFVSLKEDHVHFPDLALGFFFHADPIIDLTLKVNVPRRRETKKSGKMVIFLPFSRLFLPLSLRLDP